MDRIKNRWLRLLVHLVLWMAVVASVLPFLWTVLNSIKFPVEANKVDPSFWGFDATSFNFAKLWLLVKGSAHQSAVAEFVPVGTVYLAAIFLLVILCLLNRRWGKVPGVVTGIGVVLVLGIMLAILPSFVQVSKFYGYLINSVIITAATLLVSISIGCLAGYGLARYQGRASVVILIVALGFRALPRLSFGLPFYYFGQLTGLYDTHFLMVVVLVAVNQPFTIWMLRSFFMEVPKELEQAAMIDGAGPVSAFVRVIVPISWPGIITTSLFTLLLAYNEFLLGRLLLQTNWTLPVAIASYTSGEDAAYRTIAAAASVSITLPIIFVIIFFQKHLVKGLASGAVKG